MLHYCIEYIQMYIEKYGRRAFESTSCHMHLSSELITVKCVACYWCYIVALIIMISLGGCPLTDLFIDISRFRY